ncbi:cytochrome P450 6g1-like, partial [Chironomus tepperi]|uniref:cytochrome P450 6g1-like n=1 Tax=Chironomus tepperi TaxID=113505 RepID=UPI00391F314F
MGALILIAIIFLLITLWFFWQQTYFKRHNIPYVQTNILLGGLSDSLLKKCGFFENVLRLYTRPEVKDVPFFGFFIFQRPALVIKDPELIKRIMIKDFNSFKNHVTASHDADPLGKYNLIFVKNPLWKTLRVKLTPFFSSGKLKKMFYIMDTLSSDLINYIDKRIPEKGDKIELNVRELAAMYTTDVIASAAFGLKANTLENPDSDFRQVGRRLYTFSFKSGLGRFLQSTRPEIVKYLGYKRFDDESSDFIRTNVRHVMEDRQKTGEIRHDLIDILNELKKMDLRDVDGKPIHDDVLYAQAAAFFIGKKEIEFTLNNLSIPAGFETSSSSSSFALYELVRNPQIQERVRAEIKEMLKTHNGEITYDGIMNETPFLFQVLLEAIRLYPVVPWIDRECTDRNGYSLEPYSSFRIPYKFQLYIPVFPLHRDEKFHPDPMKFDPDRFGQENQQNCQQCSFI